MLNDADHIAAIRARAETAKPDTVREVVLLRDIDTLLAALRAERETVARLREVETRIRQTANQALAVVYAVEKLMEFDHKAQNDDDPTLDYTPYYEQLDDALQAYRALLADGGVTP